MSPQFDLNEMEEDFQELLDSEDYPPEAFYLALKQALQQLENHTEAVQAA